MRLVTFQRQGTDGLLAGIQISRYEVISLADEVKRRGLTVCVDTMLDIIRGGPQVRELLDEIERQPLTEPVLLNQALLKAPIPRPAKNVFCVGWNYLEHFAEGGRQLEDRRELPQHPVFFSKAPTTVNGPFDPIPYPEGLSVQLDWEAELGVIIGKGGINITESEALDHVFGYTVINDFTWRDIQRRHGGQWFKGKSLDGTCPMGPCIVTADALDPSAVSIECRVSGVMKQQSNTRHLYFSIPRLIASLSQGMTLEPGDILSTGTPEGVGFARNPPEWLSPGDLVETSIEGIGVLRNPIGAP